MGTLYVVGTPIGNLEDISFRALRVLREVDVIAAEDTRHTRKLLSHFDIHTPLVSYHEHNQRAAGPALIERLRAGEDIALVTDAGMPAISDPGQDLVRQAIEAGVAVVPVPGPTAFITALVVSGLPTDRFVFEGFLPHKTKERRTALERLQRESRTCILYEAPHRLVRTLKDLQDALGERPMAVARELTKVHEEVLRGTPAELLGHFTKTAPRGEFVLVISGAEERSGPEMGEVTPESLAEAVADLERSGVDRKTAMKQVAAQCGVSKREVYRAVVQAKTDLSSSEVEN